MSARVFVPMVMSQNPAVVVDGERKALTFPTGAIGVLLVYATRGEAEAAEPGKVVWELDMHGWVEEEAT